MSEEQMKNSVSVLVVGSGKLATELLLNLKSAGIASVLPWSEKSVVGKGKVIVVHAGSGREFDDAVSFCAETRSVLIELSTGNDINIDSPVFPVIVCPNVNILMLKFMAMIARSGTLFDEYEKSVIESHQSAKTSEPGTAINIADSLGVKREDIVSVRDPEVQEKKLSIPPDFIPRHAYHKISISDANVTVSLESRVYGEAPYSSGLAKIIEAVCDKNLDPGIHNIVELIEQGWL